jgi:hypothetical protein
MNELERRIATLTRRLAYESRSLLVLLAQSHTLAEAEQALRRRTPRARRVVV